MASSNSMVSYRGIIPQLFMQKKISFNTIKNCKKVEIVYVTTSSYNYYLTLFNTILTFTSNITYLAGSYKL